MSKITPFLWYDKEAEEAANFYVSVFPNSKVTQVARYPEGGPGPAGSVMTVSFELDGLPFTALNAGPHFKFTEAISFVVDCKDQAEVDHYWDGLLEGGGQESQCGWLKDRFGLSWQVTPRRLIELTTNADPEVAQRVFGAMMKMVKIDIPTLEAAARNEAA
jgi:predicted 3-demethylubiquinone-9 3-methyltransferase (glyoxalase superfamily)